MIVISSAPGTRRNSWMAVALLPWMAVAGTLPPNAAQLDRERILRAAAAALRSEPITITRFPARMSQGGPNDFYSNGDYWWPDPSKPDGLPYIQRDGQSNPDNFNQHRLCVTRLRDAVAALGAAYKVTGDDRYATKAAELLRVFFIEPKTRMNPSLNYAQAIPGRTPGRGIGIIDTLHLIEIPVAIEAMKSSPGFPSGLLDELKSWFQNYADWMITSTNGKEEAAAKNNHSVAYFLQLAVFARFSGDEPKLSACRREYKEVFVPKQMALDGSFPAELKRTKPYGYSIFQLDNLATLCQVLSTQTDNLWNFRLPDGRGMRKAMDFLYPYLADKTAWPHKPDVQSWEGWPARQPCLLFAGVALGQQSWLKLWEGLAPDPVDPEIRRNIAITQPLLWVTASAMPTPQRPADWRHRVPASAFQKTGENEWISPLIHTPFAFDELVYCWHLNHPGDSFRLYLKVAFEPHDETDWLYAGFWGRVHDMVTERKAPVFDRGVLDMDWLKLKAKATAFRFKVVSAGVEPLPGCPALSVIATDNEPEANAARVRSVAPKTPGARVLDVPLRRQVDSEGRRMRDRCQSAALASAMEYFGKPVPLEAITRFTFDPEYNYPGIWPRVIAAAGEFGFDGYLDRFRDWAEVRKALAENKVLLCSIRLKEGECQKPPYPSMGNHIVALCGVTDDGRVVVTDSALGKSGTGYLCQWLQSDFEIVWMRTKGGVAMVICPPPGAPERLVSNLPSFPAERSFPAGDDH